MADDQRDPNEDRDDLSSGASSDPDGRELASELPDPEVNAGGEIDADADGVPDLEQPDEGYDASDDNEALVAATASAAGRGNAPRRKTAPTPKQKRSAAPEPQRTGPVQFVGQSVDELKKVVWPTGAEVRSYYIVVLVFVLFIIAIVSVLDLAFGLGVTRLFG